MKKIIISLIMTLCSCLAFAQDATEMYIWKVHTITLRDGITRQAMEKSEFLKPSPPPQDQEKVTLLISTFNSGAILGNIMFGKSGVIINFNYYDMKYTNDGHKYIEFKNTDGHIVIQILLNINDTSIYQDSLILTLYKDNLVTQYVYMLKRITGFD